MLRLEAGGENVICWSISNHRVTKTVTQEMIMLYGVKVKA